MNEFEIAGIVLIGVFGFLALYCAKKLIDEVEENMEDWEPEKREEDHKMIGDMGDFWNIIGVFGLLALCFAKKLIDEGKENSARRK